MQTLDIISVNIWHILISLANLALIFWIVKKFLFAPVRNMLDARQAEIDKRYQQADEAKAQAESDRLEWNEKMQTADEEAKSILTEATETAKFRADQILADANDRADGILRRAEAEADLERKKATEGIKREIIDVSSLLAEKMLEREVNENDHRALIDSFIEKIGE
ncbi:MAG: F0F1 ATP synthase subunit B [Oscillospiraceae bacterium]|nr:F0F1 ATP synthase subunit B [Oscillospiraceae bacterium]